ncbi:hypothetical protein VTK73DRAFT_9169 [Phialemonium thermophilum]|uniref:Uncharacterized protein n=1 Tax=Phialemonium thermophilum TaxID=223376 RepID=A0ABR3W420_9PEZI
MILMSSPRMSQGLKTRPSSVNSIPPRWDLLNLHQRSGNIISEAELWSPMAPSACMAICVKLKLKRAVDPYLKPRLGNCQGSNEMTCESSGQFPSIRMISFPKSEKNKLSIGSDNVKRDIESREDKHFRSGMTRKGPRQNNLEELSICGFSIFWDCLWGCLLGAA